MRSSMLKKIALRNASAYWFSSSLIIFLGSSMLNVIPWPALVKEAVRRDLTRVTIL